MRLNRVEIFGSLDTRFQSKILSGLTEMTIHMDIIPNSFSWLPLFSSTHPNLGEVWLLNVRRYFFAHDAPLFLSSLIKGLQERELYIFYNIAQVGLRRAVGQPSQGWYVMGLTLTTTIASTSLIEVLMLVASLFPKLKVFTLNLSLHNMRYEIDDLVSALAQFPSLRVVYLNDVFYWLDFDSGNKKTTLVVTVEPVKSPVVDVFRELRAHYESGLSLFTSCLAEQVRSLDSVHINDKGYDSDISRGWYLSGWIHVLNSNRDIGGTLLQYDVHTH
ncbi:hypothetical protein F5880DRAFT_1617711 [Lentinula raphanica]|nr:hypothetical protein F5880DRAFT_1617711 [Lentinula raphanica]